MTLPRLFCVTCQQYIGASGGWEDWNKHRGHLMEQDTAAETINAPTDVVKYLENHKPEVAIPPERLHRILTVLAKDGISLVHRSL